MNYNTSITKLAALTILSLACTTGCSFDLEDLKDLDLGVEVDGDSDSSSPKTTPQSSATDEDTVNPQMGEVYEGGTHILLKDPGIRFDVPSGMYGTGDSEYFDIGHEAWMGLVSIYGSDVSREELDPALTDVLDWGDEYWVPMDDAIVDDDSTSIDYYVEGSTDGVSFATITAVYGDYGVASLIIGLGMDETAVQVIDVVDEVAATTGFTAPAN